MRVLILEDDPEVRTTLARVVRRAGHQVEHVATCADALSCAAGAFYDVVVSDFELPDGLGSDVLAAIRVHAPETILILMSGGVIPASARVSVNLLLEKPFAHASLVRFLAGGRGTSEP